VVLIEDMTSTQIETALPALFSQYAYNGYYTSKSYQPKFIRDFEQIILGEILALSSNFHSPVILDVGCGTGCLLELVRTNLDGCVLIGVDLSQGMIEKAKQTTSPQITYFVGDAHTLLFEDNSIDIVVCQKTSPFLDLEIALREFGKLTRSDGYLILTTLMDTYQKDDLVLPAMFDCLVRPFFEFFTGEASLRDILQTFSVMRANLKFQREIDKFLNEPISNESLKELLESAQYQLVKMEDGHYCNTRVLTIAQKGGD